MANTYEAYAVMDNQAMVMTDEVHDTPMAALNEMLNRGYSMEEMHENGFTLVKLLCEDGKWIECLEERNIEAE